jgi:hypothetical protein
LDLIAWRALSLSLSSTALNLGSLDKGENLVTDLKNRSAIMFIAMCTRVSDLLLFIFGGIDFMQKI